MENHLTDNGFYDDIRVILQKARTRAYTAVNTAMVEAYWLIGKRIVDEEQRGKLRADYGKNLIKNLSLTLNSEFGKGFSIANLKNFRQFYLTFQDDKKGYTLCSQLSWSHIRLIMRLDTPQARDYYSKETKNSNWSVRQLQRNISSHYFERILSTDEPETETLPVPGNDKQQIRNFLKDPYVLEFLELPENNTIKEASLEQSIIDNPQAFLLEFGKGFSFVGRQFRISTETSHFYIDLVFYNYLLKCFKVA